MSVSMIESVKLYLLELQKHICDAISNIDGKSSFIQDTWKRDDDLLRGSGITAILENGAIFEKAGVNFSHVYGARLPASAFSEQTKTINKPFEALGISLVIHPDNPYIPTSHANIRFFMTQDEYGHPVWWFGGGYDLTPYYGFEEDCVHWHSVAKAACESFGESIYPELKRWCDEYFYLPHRKEQRGIGGLFFDHWNRWEFERCFEFAKNIGNSYLPAYIPIVEKRKSMLFGEREKKFQKIRHGRYVEFNLVCDRGTQFGLQSGGRTESILMSLPKEACWQYQYTPELGTAEAQLLTDFLVKKNWIPM